MSLNTMEEYYQKVIQLQDKLRKSEEDRLNLEIKFNEMLQAIKDEEEAHFKKFRSKYKKFLEEDRRRQQRNDRILEALDRIENRTAIWEAKTEKFKEFRKRYQKHLKHPTPLPHDYETPPTGKENFAKDEIMEKYMNSLSLHNNDEFVKPRHNLSTPQEDKYPKLGNINSISPKPSYSHDLTQLKTTKDHENSLKQNSTLPIFGNSYETPKLYLNNSKDYEYQTSFEEKDTPQEIHNKLEGLLKETYKNGSVTRKPSITNESTNLNKQTSHDISVNLGQHENFGLGKLSPSFGRGSATLSTSCNKGHPPETYLNNMLSQHDNQKAPQASETSKETESEKYFRRNSIETNKPAVDSTIINDSPIKSSRPLDPIPDKEVKSAVVDPLLKETLLNVHQEPNNPQQIAKKENVTSILEECSEDLLEGTKTLEGQSQLYQELAPNHDEQSIKPQESVIDQNGPPMRPTDQPSYQHKLNEQVQYDKTGQIVFQSDQQGYYQNGPSSENDQYFDQYNENGKSFQQYNEIAQLPPDENKEPVGQYRGNNQPLEYDQSGQPVYQYSENEPLSQQLPYNENGQPIPQYDENGQLLQQFNQAEQLQCDENGQPNFQYDENREPLQQYQTEQLEYDNSQSALQYDENEQAQQQYNEFGQYDQNTQLYEQTEQLQYDKNGQPIYHYDENGQLLQQYNQAEQLHYDESGQPIYQYDENGQPLQQFYDENGQPIQYYDNSVQGQYYNEQNPDQYQYEEQHKDQGEISNVQEKQQDMQPVVIPKPSTAGVLDMLESDSESLQQDSKLTTDSDFDFSNK